MSFITFPFFIGGLAAAAIPILLHLLMRGKPKRIEFPALMFVKKRLDIQRRNYQLKHLILLALRIAILVLFGLALARPTLKLADWLPGLTYTSSVDSGNPSGFVSNLATSLGSQEAPIATVLVIDNSVRMQYRSENKTRLEVAREFARWILRQLPEGSNIGVLSTEREAPVFQVDILAAENKIERIQSISSGRSVAEAVLDALSLLNESKFEQRELYILTDLADPAWPMNLADSLRELVEQSKPVQNLFGGASGKELGIFVVDIGVKQPSDSGIIRLSLSSQTASPQSTVYLETEFSHLGSACKKTVDLILLDPMSIKTDEAGESETVRDTKTIDFPEGESKRIEHFALTGLRPGVQQGMIRFTVPDALTPNDRIFFSIQVEAMTAILLVSQPPVRDSSLFLRQALETIPFRTKIESYAELSTKTQKELKEYAAVILLDPPDLSPAVWRKLADYASDGFGVGVVLGPAVGNLPSFNDSTATEILGAKLVRQARQLDGELWIVPENEASPILTPFRQLDSLNRFPWDAQSVFRYWELDELSPRAEIAMPFSNGRPAVLTQILGKGRTLTMTTPISQLGEKVSPWNFLPQNEANWMFVLLAEALAKYLVGEAELNFNYTVGEPIVLYPTTRNDEFPASCLLASPSGNSVRLTTDSQQRSVRIPSATEPGNYRIRSGGEQQSLDLGFSVNLSGDEMRLQRIDREQLDRFFGNGNFRLVRTPKEIEIGIARRRVGQELYTMILFTLIAVFVTEYIFSNRFYGTKNKS